jgi:hypothetical protein
VRSHEVEALAGERLGTEIQAVELLRAAGAAGLDIWAVLTEHGTFWLVEGPAGAELLRPIGGGWDSVARAVDRYRGLHPEAGIPAAALEPYRCRGCGAAVAPLRPSARTERGLCTRCLRADSQRRRYREDPEHRARDLARRRARRRGRVPR